MAAKKTVKNRAYSLGELHTKAVRRKAELRRKTKWGRWTLDRSELTLTHTHDHHRYEVDLAECTSSAGVLDWIFQLHEKTWMTPKDMRDLIEALSYIVDPQKTLCSFGHESATGKTAVTSRLEDFRSGKL